MKSITLSDGRTLTYAEYGEPDGKPIFFFHGTPGSRLFTPPNEVTIRLGVRLICTDRPGYGGSTFQPGRHLLDWPQDVSELADALGIRRFHLIGHSGGGPHTLACAYSLPKRVLAAATLSGAGPANAPHATKGMILLNRFGIKYGRYLPWFAFNWIARSTYRQRCTDPEKFIRSEVGKRPPADDEVFSDPEIFNLCVRSEKEAFLQGIEGLVWDARLITTPWGFDLAEIEPPVHVWHGTADNVTTLYMAKYMAEKIPNASLTVCKNEGHMLLIPHWEEILKDLIT